ncbi:hypothetical protein NPIL_324031 [Nephila pilipes]|uniref:Uncharacterized protein n=1 Tax=Nephila pilipes TaxID=299642 RepID=A0A8X6NQW0_NEPPI|nr:hypothetical protein NPIL_324031 [Nephila pilipes]
MCFNLLCRGLWTSSPYRDKLLGTGKFPRNHVVKGSSGRFSTRVEKSRALRYFISLFSAVSNSLWKTVIGRFQVAGEQPTFIADCLSQQFAVACFGISASLNLDIDDLLLRAFIQNPMKKEAYEEHDKQ